MKRLLLGLVLALSASLPIAQTVLAAPDPVNCTGYPEPRVFLESQAWWNKAGIKVPSAVGHHVHVGMCTPLDGTILNGTVHFDVRVILHGQEGDVKSVRYADGSNVKQTKSVSFTQNDVPYWISFDIPFSTWSTGRHEIRWTANVPDEQLSVSGSQRMYNSTGWQYCVRSCSPNIGGRTTNWTESRGWYQDRGYANARFRSPVPKTVLSGSWTFSYEARPGSGGFPTKFWGVYVDPDMHTGIAGPSNVFPNGIRPTGTTSSGTRSTTVNTRLLADGTHKLVIISSDGLNAGVQVVTFKTNN